MPRFTAAEIRRYYDRHTSAFVAVGQRGTVGTIHRAVWGPGVSSRAQAFHYVEDYISEHVRRVPSPDMPHVVDLGCGGGASLCYLAERLPIRGTGVTLSPVQVRLAAQRIRKGGLSDRVVCVEGDYGDLPASVESADVAYAIESFVHGPDPARFFAECGRVVRPNGVLVICDDFKRPTTEPLATPTIDRFCRGWHINSLLGPSELRALARTAGFEHEATLDLSPYLELHRARDRAAKVLLALLDWLPRQSSRLGYLTGGSALQECLDRGWLGYDLVVFRRVGSGEPPQPAR
jgi:tocopherol O-methyltransferase